MDFPDLTLVGGFWRRQIGVMFVYFSLLCMKYLKDILTSKKSIIEQIIKIYKETPGCERSEGGKLFVASILQFCRLLEMSFKKFQVVVSIF